MRRAMFISKVQCQGNYMRQPRESQKHMARCKTQWSISLKPPINGQDCLMLCPVQLTPRLSYITRQAPIPGTVCARLLDSLLVWMQAPVFSTFFYVDTEPNLFEWTKIESVHWSTKGLAMNFNPAAGQTWVEDSRAFRYLYLINARQYKARVFWNHLGRHMLKFLQFGHSWKKGKNGSTLHATMRYRMQSSLLSTNISGT